MNEPGSPTSPEPRDAAYWARPTARLVAVTEAARRRGLDGKRLMGPEQGFGPMWRRSYSVSLVGVELTAAEVISEWKARFGDFWPPGTSFHAPLAGIAPGELAALDLGMGQLTVLSTGVFVMYADESSFTYMTPQGHAFAAWITFSCEQHDGVPTAHVDLLLRAADPIADVAYRLGGARKEDRFWAHTLTSLAAGLGAAASPVESSAECVDPQRQWRRWVNIRFNGGPRALLHGFRAPRAG